VRVVGWVGGGGGGGGVRSDGVRRVNDGEGETSDGMGINREWGSLLQRCSRLASYPGLHTPVFVACSTNAGEGLVHLSHMV